jgi:hypothetical protein
LPEEFRDFKKILLKNEVNNRRYQEIFTTLSLTVVDPVSSLYDRFKDLREESPHRCDKMLSLNILLELRSRFSSFPKCDDMISKPGRELMFLRVSHDEPTICIIDRN